MKVGIKNHTSHNRRYLECISPYFTHSLQNYIRSEAIHERYDRLKEHLYPLLLPSEASK